MLQELASQSKVIGVKQSRKAIGEGHAAKAFFADNADPALIDPLREACVRQGVSIESGMSCEELGRACKISVGAAVAVLLK
ncbi:MAG: ribosomal L7Ae/L30e/S12e/Gadd45 family protein [Oscillospiraceae bacterium]